MISRGRITRSTMIRQIAISPTNISHNILGARWPEMGRNALGKQKGDRPDEDQPGNSQSQRGRVASTGDDQRPPRKIDHAQQHHVYGDRPQGQALMKGFHQAPA